MEEERRKKRKVAVVILVIVAVVIVVGCTVLLFQEKASWYTEEQHLQRVKERVEKKFMEKDSQLTSFSVSPMYDENDRFKYVLVEFEPSGYLFVDVREATTPLLFAMFGAQKSMYKCDIVTTRGRLYSREWSRYYVDVAKTPKKQFFELDSNGEEIIYTNSPFKVAGIDENEKKYFFKLGGEYIPAVKTDDGYLNLISLSEVLFNEDGSLYKEQATIYAPFIAKPEFDL